MTRTLITGAAGFTGRYLTSLLAAQGHDVHGIVHHDDEEPIADLAQLHVADLADRAAIGRVVTTVKPDHVVHLAAIANVAHGSVDEIYRANVVGTRHLLDALVQCAASVKSVVVASSASIYGNARDGVLDETMSPAPANDYGVSKVATEYLARMYGARIPVIIVRPFNYTGRGQSTNFLIPKIVDHARRGEPAISLGNLDVARDFSDVRKVVAAYSRLLEAPEAVGGTFNICSGRAVSLAEILDMVAEITGHRFVVRVDPALVRANEVRTLSGTEAKLDEVIGQIDPVSLHDTLRWMLRD